MSTLSGELLSDTNPFQLSNHLTSSISNLAIPRLKEPLKGWSLFQICFPEKITSLIREREREREREVKWSEMKWNEMKWNEMKWNEMKWNEMKWNEMKWNEMKWNEMKCRLNWSIHIKNLYLWFLSYTYGNPNSGASSPAACHFATPRDEGVGGMWRMKNPGPGWYPSPCSEGACLVPP
jgi:hypothetical protein